MNFDLDEDHRMIAELVRRFVDDELVTLENKVLERDIAGHGLHLTPEEHARVDRVSRELGLWGLDAPEDVGGHDLPAVAMVGVNEALGRTIVPFTLPPDSPNLRMLAATVDDRQREAYLAPYVRGETISAIGISEPGAGTDPAGMKTSAVRDGDDWIINGRKIWITKANRADFTILMAVTDKERGRARRDERFPGRQGRAGVPRRPPDPDDRRRDDVRGRAGRLPRAGVETARQGGVRGSRRCSCGWRRGAPKWPPTRSAWRSARWK